MNNFKLHYYGLLDSIEGSCYSFEEFIVNGYSLFIQCSGRFGIKESNFSIENPAMFVRRSNHYLRFDVEGLIVQTDAYGHLLIDNATLKKLHKELNIENE